MIKPLRIGPYDKIICRNCEIVASRYRKLNKCLLEVSQDVRRNWSGKYSSVGTANETFRFTLRDLLCAVMKNCKINRFAPAFLVRVAHISIDTPARSIRLSRGTFVRLIYRRCPVVAVSNYTGTNV